MQQRKNVWVDGSLRDTDWYDKVFDNIRKVRESVVRRHEEIISRSIFVSVPSLFGGVV